MRYDDKLRESVIADYNAKILTVDQIAQKYNIARRTIYSWVSANHGRKYKLDRQAVYLSKDETETLLLLILCAEDMLTDKQKYIAKALEQRLLDIADNF